MVAVAIVGAGPAGSYLSYLLARQKIFPVLFDPLAPWEKPCGGGLTFRTLVEFPLISTLPHRVLHKFHLISYQGLSCHMELQKPLHIFSRKDLNGFLLEKAQEAGAQFIREKVVRVERRLRGWLLRTEEGRSYECDIVVGADGAQSMLRHHLLGILLGKEASVAFVVYPKAQEPGEWATIQFLPREGGYLWAFPRMSHTSIGVCFQASWRRAEEVKQKLYEFLEGHCPRPDGLMREMKKAFIPSSLRLLRENSSGDSWALLGDAAGFIDPITREGIYYALKSAHFLAQAIANEDLREYESLCHKEVKAELRKAHQWRGLFYRPTFTHRMIEMALEHRGIRAVLADLLAGEQSYMTLSERLCQEVHKGALRSYLPFASWLKKAFP